MATDQIDELIEESYLLSLPEQEVRSHLKVFLEACESVLKQCLTARRDLRIVGVKVALLRAKFLLNAKHLPQQDDVATGSDTHDQALIQQVMQTKRMVRRLLSGIDSDLPDMLDREEKRLRDNPVRKRTFSFSVAAQTAVYYFMLIGILFVLLVYLGH